jgi:hypothetical protein
MGKRSFRLYLEVPGRWFDLVILKSVTYNKGNYGMGQNYLSIKIKLKFLHSSRSYPSVGSSYGDYYQYSNYSARKLAYQQS